MKIAGKTDIGLYRKENQDNYRAGRQPDDTVWALVCDGMGGTNGGKLASSTAAAYMENKFLQELMLKETQEEIQAFLHEVILKANKEIFKLSRTLPDNKGMGTTVVCAIIKQGVVYYAHVGDSRIYHYTNGTLTQLTKDHSMVQELVEQGTITEQEAYRHPRKNLITRALGVLPTVTVDCARCSFSPQDSLLLCTDGLTNYLGTEEILQVLGQVPFFEQADVLIEKALAAGGQDNITALLVQDDAGEENHG